MKRKSAVFVILFLLVGCAAMASQKRDSVPIDDSPQRGPANALVLIVEFSNYT
jgi:uncharacterized protein YcfL